MWIRLVDIISSGLGLVIFSPVMFLIAICCSFDSGSPLFMQKRVGRYQRPFKLLKFRTMKLDTQQIPTHLVDSSSVTILGQFLRRTKLDELPQLWNVLKGEMSIVGPRPCLFNQLELIEEREIRGVFLHRPGITGLAQINDIDMSKPKLLAKIDSRMVCNFSLELYFSCIFKTLLGSGKGDRILEKK